MHTRHPLLFRSTALSRLMVACAATVFATAFATPATAQGPARLAVRVLDPGGAPVAGAQLEATPAGGGPTRSASTGADGVLRIDGLAGGRYRVVVTAPAWSRIVTTVTVPLQGAEPLELRFRSLALTENVTVSATGTARDTLSVPGEVSIIEREAFDKLQARSLDGVLRYEPGVEMGSTRRLMETPTIRGFDASRVLVLRDGARVSQFTSGHKGALFLEVNDIERVEVVRGPASALYGSGALGGVLSIKSAAPRDLLRRGESVGGYVSTMYSSAHGELMMRPRFYGASADGFGFALGYTARRNDGLVKVAGDLDKLDYAEEDIDAFDGRLVAPVGRSGTLSIGFNAFGQDGRSSINLANAIVEPDEQVQRTTRQQTLTVTYETGGDAWWHENVSASAYYSAMDLDEVRPVDGREDGIELDTWGFDLRNTAALGGGQRFTYGVELFRDREGSTRNDDVNPLFPPAHQTQVGLYVQDEITALDGRWVIVPGVRWDRWAIADDTAGPEGRADHRFNPKLGSSFEIVAGLVASANYSEGFRTPNFQELFISGTHFNVPLGPRMNLLGIFTPNPELVPETSRNVDFGLRYRRNGLAARAAYYRAWVDDFIDFEVTRGFRPPGTVLLTFTNENVHEATLEGFEAELRWDVGVNWTVSGTYASPRGADAATGEALSTVPPDKTTLGIEYRAPTAAVTVGTHARIVGDHDRVPEGVDPVAGHTLLDIYSAWTPSFLPAITLRFNVDNAGDREYRVPLLGIPGVGRDFRFGVTWRLGR